MGCVINCYVVGRGVWLSGMLFLFSVWVQFRSILMLVAVPVSLPVLALQENCMGPWRWPTRGGAVFANDPPLRT